MKRKILIGLVFSLAFVLANCNVSYAQSRTNRLFRPCAGTSTPATVTVARDGDIDLVPCVGRDVFINGVAASTTITYSGASRTNYFPYFSTQTNLAKSPFSWNGTTYVANNTAENAVFKMEFTPSVAQGIFAAGDYETAGMSFLRLNQENKTIEGHGSEVKLGDTTGSAGATLLTINDTNLTITANAANGIALSSAGQIDIGDTLAGAGGTTLSIINGSREFFFNASAADGRILFLGVNEFLYRRTITPAATTGNQTINRPSGTVNFETGSGTAGITVTNSTVNTTSIVYAIARTDDSNCFVKSVVPAAGSFVIRMTNDCSVVTSVGFLVTN